MPENVDSRSIGNIDPYGRKAKTEKPGNVVNPETDEDPQGADSGLPVLTPDRVGSLDPYGVRKPAIVQAARDLLGDEEDAEDITDEPQSEEDSSDPDIVTVPGGRIIPSIGGGLFIPTSTNTPLNTLPINNFRKKRHIVVPDQERVINNFPEENIIEKNFFKGIKETESNIKEIKYENEIIKNKNY